jgi:hypothetical protein
MGTEQLKMAEEKCRVDLSRTDLYEGNEIPDGDVEVCLKVLRTFAAFVWEHEYYGAHDKLTTAMDCVMQWVFTCQEQESAADRQETVAQSGPSGDPEEDHRTPDPDLVV